MGSFFSALFSRLFSRLVSSLFSSTRQRTPWRSDAYFAMECGWFCVLCGAPLDITGEAHNLDPDDERYRVSTIRVPIL
jgi:hypothetical protein